MELEAPTLASEAIGHIGFFELRNTMLMAWLAMIVLLGIGFGGKGTGYRMIPSRLQAFLEIIIEGLFNLCESVLGSAQTARRVFPFVATIFLFIVTANWMGILPGVGSILIEGVHEGHAMMLPLLRSMNADVNMTLALAMSAIVYVHAIGIATLGFLSHITKFLVPPWHKPYLIGTAVGLLEFVGEFSRIISFSFRLFGNIFAGEVLLVVVSFLVPFAAPIPFMGLELFVGFIQGLVFAMLTLVFLGMSMEGHGEHEEHEGIHKAELSRRVLNQT